MGFKRPESVLVVIYTRDAQFLLLRRTQPADFWQSVTGSLEPGETPEQAARRELFEETGLSAEGVVDAHQTRRFAIIPAWRARYAPEVQENVEHLFWCCLDQTCTVRLSAEHSESIWLARAAAARQASSWTNREAILSPVLPGIVGLHPR